MPRVTSSELVVWNCGDTTITGDQVVEGDRLRIQVPEGGQILKHTTLLQTREVNGWRFDQQAPHCVNLVFDFLDPGDGIAIEIIHSEAGQDLDIAGTIRGMSKGFLRYGPAFLVIETRLRSAPFPLSRPRLMLWVTVAIGTLIMLFGLLLPELIEMFPSVFDPSDPVDPQRYR